MLETRFQLVPGTLIGVSLSNCKSYDVASGTEDQLNVVDTSAYIVAPSAGLVRVGVDGTPTIVKLRVEDHVPVPELFLPRTCQVCTPGVVDVRLQLVPDTLIGVSLSNCKSYEVAPLTEDQLNSVDTFAYIVAPSAGVLNAGAGSTTVNDRVEDHVPVPELFFARTFQL